MKVLFEANVRIGGIDVTLYDYIPSMYWLQMKTD